MQQNNKILPSSALENTRKVSSSLRFLLKSMHSSLILFFIDLISWKKDRQSINNKKNLSFSLLRLTCFNDAWSRNSVFSQKSCLRNAPCKAAAVSLCTTAQVHFAQHCLEHTRCLPSLSAFLFYSSHIVQTGPDSEHPRIVSSIPVRSLHHLPAVMIDSNNPRLAPL